MGHLAQLFTGFFQSYGLWALFALLLLENAGLPLPGEAALLYASFLAHASGPRQLGLVIVVGVAACTLGDNTGYWIGRRAGLHLRRLLRLTPERIRWAERYFQRFGNGTILVARFVAGLRIIAGPVAGISRMPALSFALFNFAGAALWVTAIALLGYNIAHHWQHVMHTLDRVDVAILVLVIAGLWLLLRRLRREFEP